MKKFFLGTLLFIAIAAIAAFNTNVNIQAPDSYLLTLANIEALANESEVPTYYCCGNKGICAQGDYLVIHGKFQTKPCK